MLIDDTGNPCRIPSDVLSSLFLLPSNILQYPCEQVTRYISKVSKARSAFTAPFHPGICDGALITALARTRSGIMCYLKEDLH